MNICRQIASLLWAEAKFISDHDGNDYFSTLPSEVVALIAEALPDQDVKALHNVNKKIQLATKKRIDFIIIKKFEETILNTPGTSPFFDFNTLPNKLEERIKKLREGICSWLLGFQNDIKLDHRLIWVYTERFCNLEHQLATQVLKIIHEDLNQPFVYSYSNKALRKRFFLAWDMLESNRIGVKHFKVHVETIKDHLLDFNHDYFNGKILTTVLKVIQDHFLDQVSIKVWGWDVKALREVLEAVKSNHSIHTITISEGYLESGWGHNERLNSIITDQLQPDFNKIHSFKKNEWTCQR